MKGIITSSIRRRLKNGRWWGEPYPTMRNSQQPEERRKREENPHLCNRGSHQRVGSRSMLMPQSLPEKGLARELLQGTRTDFVCWRQFVMTRVSGGQKLQS
ncbi:unnamed protein product [Linum trigynum]|uniref:Uncharacterized protein n=1 Tax=Linum trigynum TaxID=586398 RepID=A0AAV2EYC3_9ROSI